MTYLCIKVLDGALKDFASVFGPVRAARELVNELVGQVDVYRLSVWIHESSLDTKPTELLVVALVITTSRPVGREVKHDGALAPIFCICRAVGHLAKEVQVRLAEFDVDATAVGRRHESQLLGLIIEELAHTLKHVICPCHRESQLERVAPKIIIPDRELIRVETADEYIVMISIHGPLFNGLVRGLLTEVGTLPLAEEDLLHQPIGRRKVLATVHQGSGSNGLDFCYGERRLEALLFTLIDRDIFVVAPAKLSLVRPPLQRVRQEISEPCRRLTQKFAVAYGPIMASMSPFSTSSSSRLWRNQHKSSN